MAMPNRARITRKTVRLGANAVARPSREYRPTSSISTGRRPNRSARRPKMNAPKGLQARVSMMATATCFFSTPNSLATSFKTNTSRKKSKASSAQPRKLAVTTLFCAGVQPFRAFKSAMEPS
jgi:hypothetical protein